MHGRRGGAGHHEPGTTDTDPGRGRHAGGGWNGYEKGLTRKAAHGIFVFSQASVLDEFKRSRGTR